MYFGDDMSLSEIAAELGVSRQAVQQSIAKGRNELETFEKKLGLCGRFRAAKVKVEEVKALACELQKSVSEKDISGKCGKIAEAADGLMDII